MHLPRIIIAASLLCTIHAQDIRRAPSEKDAALAGTMGWNVAAGSLSKILSSTYVPGRAGVAGSVGSPSYRAWLNLYQWCELLSRDETEESVRMIGKFLFMTPGNEPPRPMLVGSGQATPQDAQAIPPETLQKLVRDSSIPPALMKYVLPPGYVERKGALAESLSQEFATAMAADQEFLELFFGNLSDRDFTPMVLQNLQEIWTANRGEWKSYRNLAIAIAIVHDQRPPAWWPHPQVNRADVPLAEMSAGALFQFWVQSNENRKLLIDLRKLTPQELTFVVDAPISPTELEWAQANTKFSRGDFGRAFSSIRYREDRLADGNFVWNEGPYTLEAISKLGGICVDQAYFAMLCGKARGLPTLYFTGQGSDGGHAWFGYLKSEGRWDMDCGRYVNQKYAVGDALDPQTWLPINDHELTELAGSFRLTPQHIASQADLAVAALFLRQGDARRANEALDSAISVCPKNSVAWNAKGAFLEKQEAAIREQKAFHEAALKEFVNNVDIKVTHQRALASLARRTGDEETARKLESNIIGQNRLGRSDLSVTTAAKQLDELLKAGRLDAANREYRDLLGRLGRNAGGDFYYQIVAPFVTELLRCGDQAGALRAVELARNSLKPEMGSILERDLGALETRVRDTP